MLLSEVTFTHRTARGALPTESNPESNPGFPPGLVCS